MPRRYDSCPPPALPPRLRRQCLSLGACVAFAVCLSVCPVSGQDQRIATFYGAYQRIRLTSDEGLTVDLNFNTASQNGLILAVRLDSGGTNAGYIAVGLASGHLHILLTDSSSQSVGNTSTEAPIEMHAWYSLTVRMVDQSIGVELRNSENEDLVFSSSLVLSELLTVRNVFLGGANSFFSRAFTTLEITEYFVGCLANGTINDREVNFAPKLDGYGMEYGCCPNPEPVSWIFVSGHQNSLVFNSRLSHSRFQTDTLVISFLIRPDQDGMVFYSHEEDSGFAMAIELINGSLCVHVTNAIDILNIHSLQCEGDIVDGWRHEIEIAVAEDSLSCLVDATETRANVTPPQLPSDSIEYHIGSANVSTLETNLHVFHGHLHTVASNGLFPSFGGSLQKFQLNGLEVSLSALSLTTPTLSQACPNTHQLPTCQRLRKEVTVAELTRVSVAVTTVGVEEASTALLTEEDLILRIPDSVARAEIREAIADSIRFVVLSQPSHGSLVNASDPNTPIVQFDYSHLQERTIGYHHHGEEVATDSFLLNVTFACSSVIHQTLTVDFSVLLTNDYPVVTQLGTLAVAVGTRRVISPDVISVTDEESSNLISISYRVLSVLVDSCGTCGTAGRVEQTSSPGFSSTYFNQREVNSGEVSFQHFPEFETQPITVSLRVFDSVGAVVAVDIPVVPHAGHVTLVRNEPLSVVEGRCVVVTGDHLNADTDFNDQDPILQYSVVRAPEHGRLEIRDQGFWRPVLEPNVDFEGFTQSNVDRGHVRYCHNNASLATDSFEFQLHSTLLPGDRANFTIHAFAYADLPKPTVSMTMTPLTLPEGARVPLSEATLAVSLARTVLVPWSGERVDIGDLGLFFHLETLPNFGRVLIEGEIPTETGLETGFTLDQLVGGLVEYHHDDSENHRDLLTVRVVATNAGELPIQIPELPPITNLTISVVPVNDHTPLIDTSLITVGEGRFVMMTPGVLNITDGDRPAQVVVVRILNQDFDYGYFALSDTATPITEFTTADVANGNVYFHHNFNPSLPLSHVITIMASDTELSSQKEIEIEALPLLIDTSHVPRDNCVVNLDATSDYLSAPLLQVPFLAVEIHDLHGLDNNRLQNMVLGVTRQPLHGDLLLGDAPAVDFLLNDLENGLVTYRFRNRTNIVATDSTTVEVRYGHSEPVAMELKICINPVPVPDLERAVINDISLATNASVLIENRTFQAVDSRGRGGEQIVYLIVHPPRWGRVVDQRDGVLSNFTQAQIDQSLVFYHHVNQSSSTLRDYFIMRLCTRYVCRGEYNITVTFSVTNLTLYNHGMRVTEGSVAYITKDRLDAISPQGRVTFHIIRHPNWGKLYINVSGIKYVPQFFDAQAIASRSVWYSHSGTEESLEDSFTFNVTSDNSERISSVFTITVNPVNDNPPLLTRKEFHMIARTTRNITSDDLKAHDGDSNVNSGSLVYQVIYGPNFGLIHYRNDTRPSSSLRRWREDDVRENRLAYTHTDERHLQQELLEIIGVKLFDRNQSVTNLIQIHINEIQLKVVKATEFAVREGEEGVVAERHLNAVAIGDESVTKSDLRYQLTSLPRHGRVLLSGALVTNFTQADLSGPGLVYRHDHSNTISDSFNFTVTISRHDARATGTFTITVASVDDDAPTLIFHHQPLFVLEGEEINIISKYLEVMDFDTDMTLPSQTNEIEFQIITRPTHGDVWRRQDVESERFRVTEVFTLYEVNRRSVKYVSHPVDDRDEIVNWSDWFLVNLTDGDNAHETPYNFTFVILPDVVSVRGTAFRVAEGGSVVVPGNAITVLHPYLRNQPGCIVISEQPSNGTFINLNTGEENISNFTTADLRAGQIEYLHNHAEKDQDSVKFTYEAHQPVNPDDATQPAGFPDKFTRTSDVVVMDILIDTINDRGPEIRSPPNNALVMWAEDCSFLSIHHLDVTDADTPNNRLTYSFNFSSIDAYISHINNSNNIEIHSFTQEDVVNSLIKLFHRSGERGVMHYTVSDGMFSVSGQLAIETHRLEIVVLRNTPLSVPMNRMVAVTPENLHVGTSDTNSTISRCLFNEAIQYLFEAKYGIIVVNGLTNATSFTDEDLKKGRVYYRHTRPEIWEPLDVVKLKAKAILTEFKEFYLNVTIHLPSEPHSPLAVHRPLSVVEGGRTCLSERVIDARNIRYEATKVAFNKTLTTWFLFFHTEDSHGEILVDGRRPDNNPTYVTQDQIAGGRVCYQNSGDEITNDSLNFTVVIQDSGNYSWDTLQGLELNISVTLINDEPPVVASATLVVPVVEGFSTVVTNDSLLIVDEDNPAPELVFTLVSAPPGGQLWFDGKLRLLEHDTFTQEMVDEGKVGFEALDIGEWTAVLSFTDGKFTNLTNFTVTVSEHYVKVVGTRVLAYSQNERGAHLTAKHIVVETNGEANDTVYVVVDTPINGELRGLKEGDSFTQSDLVLEKISYVPTNFLAHSDSFKLDVTNREAENTTVTVEVKVGVWGQVKQNSELNFDSATDGDLSLPLPKNILRLSGLQDVLQRAPTIQVVRQPHLGYLEVKISTDSSASKRSSPSKRSAFLKPQRSFSYDYLNYDWVYYTWNASNTTIDDRGEGLNDSFSILVEGHAGMQPGEATITIHIKNPPIGPDRPLPPTAPPSSPGETPVVTMPFLEESGNSGFPNYALLPILGVFIALLVIILVVIVFCITQQGRIRKHWQPKVPHHQPLVVRGHDFPLRPPGNMYDIAPDLHGEAMTSLNEGAEFGGAHSPISRQSPQARYSPMASPHPPTLAIFPPPHPHSQHMIPRPRSRRSNVSVSYSHRPLSEATLDDLPRSRQHTFSPPLLPNSYAVHNPLQPATCASSVYEEGEGESGYLSTPNASITAGDEPVRLVLRRPVVEEVSPLPRDGDDAATADKEEEGEGEGGELSDEPGDGDGTTEGVGERGTMEEEGEREEKSRPVSTDHHRECVSRSPHLTEDATPLPSPSPPSPPLEGEPTDGPSEDGNLSPTPIGAHHQVDTPTPPSDSHRPDDQQPVAGSNSNSHHTPSPSDLQTVFRIDDPILKRTEYWV